MKYIFFLFSFIMAASILSCSKDQDSDSGMNQNIHKGLLKSMTGLVNDKEIESTELSYNDDHKLDGIVMQQGNFGTLNYQIIYQEDKVSKIIQVNDWHPSGTNNVTTTNYKVSHTTNEIILTLEDSTEFIKIETTDGFLDRYTRFHGADSEYFEESILKRDSNNNLYSLELFITNETDTNLLAYNYTFRDYENNIQLNNAFNPVIYQASIFYNPLIILALEIIISNQAPMKSDYYNGLGTIKENFVTAQTTKDTENKILTLDYQIIDLPENNYKYTFDYY